MVHGSWMLPMEYLCILVPSQSLSRPFSIRLIALSNADINDLFVMYMYLKVSEWFFSCFLFVFFTMNCFVFTLKCLSVFRWASWWKEVHHDVRRPGIFLCLLPLISIWDSIHLMCRLLNLWILFELCFKLVWTWCFFSKGYTGYTCGQMQSGSLPEPPRCFAGKDATEEFDMLHDRKVIKKYGIDEGTVVLKGYSQEVNAADVIACHLSPGCPVIFTSEGTKTGALCVSWTSHFGGWEMTSLTKIIFRIFRIFIAMELVVVAPSYLWTLGIQFFLWWLNHQLFVSLQNSHGTPPKWWAVESMMHPFSLCLEDHPT